MNYSKVFLYFQHKENRHGASAVSTFQKAEVHVVILFYAPVVGGGSLLPEGTCNGEGAVVDDGLVVIFDDDILVFIRFHIHTVNLFTVVFPLPEGTDVKIIIENSLKGYDAPCRLSLWRLAYGSMHNRCRMYKISSLPQNYL